MELAFEFDDDDFITKSKKGKQILTSYNAKLCSPLWFEAEAGSEQMKESLEQILKYKADYNYHQKKYDVAARCYAKGIEVLPQHNKIMWRDMQESLIRCHMYQGNVQQTLKLLEVLKGESVTAPQIYQTLVLMQQVYHSLSRLPDEIRVIKMLIIIHPSFHQFWYLLAEAYSKIRSNDQIQPTTDAQEQTADVKIFPCDSSSEVVNKISDIQLNTRCMPETAQTEDKAFSAMENCSPGRDNLELESNTNQGNQNSHNSCEGVFSQRQGDCQIESTNTAHNTGSPSGINVTYIPWKLLAVTSYIRAQMLIGVGDTVEDTFVKEKNKIFLEKIKKRIDSFTYSEQTLSCLKEYVRDWIRSSADQDGSSEVSDNPQEQITWNTLDQAVKDFTKEWHPFAKLPEYLLHDD